MKGLDTLIRSQSFVEIYRVSQKKRNTNSTGCHASHVEFDDLILT